MNEPATTHGPTIAQAAAACAADVAFLDGIRGLYRQLTLETQTQDFRCLGGGCCCKFDLMGHRLYLSSGELALLTTVDPVNPAHLAANRCPCQLGPRCHARELRPLGCRTFFCHSDAQPWYEETYARYHDQLRALHRRHRLPYVYADLIASLRTMQAQDSAAATRTFLLDHRGERH